MYSKLVSIRHVALYLSIIIETYAYNLKNYTLGCDRSFLTRCFYLIYFSQCGWFLIFLKIISFFWKKTTQCKNALDNRECGNYKILFLGFSFFFLLLLLFTLTENNTCPKFNTFSHELIVLVICFTNKANHCFICSFFSI